MKFGTKKKRAAMDTPERMTLPRALEIAKASSLRAAAATSYKDGVRRWTIELMPAFETLGASPPYFESLTSRLHQMATNDTLPSHTSGLAKEAFAALQAASAHLGAVMSLEAREEKFHEAKKRAAKEAREKTRAGGKAAEAAVKPRKASKGAAKKTPKKSADAEKGKGKGKGGKASPSPSPEKGEKRPPKKRSESPAPAL